MVNEYYNVLLVQIQAILVLIDAIQGQELFKSGRRIKAQSRQARAVQPITAFCTGATSSNNRYCNGDPSNTTCEATGYFVR